MGFIKNIIKNKGHVLPQVDPQVVEEHNKKIVALKQEIVLLEKQRDELSVKNQKINEAKIQDIERKMEAAEAALKTAEGLKNDYAKKNEFLEEEGKKAKRLEDELATAQENLRISIANFQAEKSKKLKELQEANEASRGKAIEAEELMQQALKKIGEADALSKRVDKQQKEAAKIEEQISLDRQLLKKEQVRFVEISDELQLQAKKNEEAKKDAEEKLSAAEEKLNKATEMLQDIEKREEDIRKYKIDLKAQEIKNEEVKDLLNARTLELQRKEEQLKKIEDKILTKIEKEKKK